MLNNKINQIRRGTVFQINEECSSPASKREVIIKKKKEDNFRKPDNITLP